MGFRKFRGTQPTCRGMALILDQLGLNARSIEDIIALDGVFCGVTEQGGEQKKGVWCGER